MSDQAGGPVTFTFTVPDMSDQVDLSSCQIELHFEQSRAFLTIELAACAAGVLSYLRDCLPPHMHADVEQALRLITGAPSPTPRSARGSTLQ